MKLKTLAITVAALAILSAIVSVLQRPPPPAAKDPRVGQPVFEPKTLEHTAQIRLRDQGKTVLLTKQADGKWIDSSYSDLPADFAKLGRLVDDLANAKVQRLVTRNPERLARLSFKDTSIALLDGAAKELWTLTLGKDAEGGGRFVKFGAEQKGYLANLGLYLDVDPKNWADSLLVDLKADDIARVEIGFDAAEPVVALRAKKDDPWAAEKPPPEQRIKGDRIASLLSSFTSLRFQDTADLNDAKVEAARQHSRTITFTTFDHQTVTVQLGRKPEEKKEIRGQTSEVRDQKPETDRTSDPASANLPAASAALAIAPTTQNSEPKPSAEAPAKAETLPPPSTAVPPPAEPEEPKIETIPAGPVYAFITHSDSAAPVNALMKKRAFQIYDWTFTSLPQKRDELFEPLPAAPPVEKPLEAKPAEPRPEARRAESPAAEPKATTPTTP
jgi:hypothetical protein